jgi:hypothetical protein
MMISPSTNRYPAPNPGHLYELRDTRDRFGGRGLTLSGPPTYVNGGGLLFNGSSHYAYAANSAYFNFGTGEFIIEAVCLFTTVSGNDAIASNYQNSSNGFSLQSVSGVLYLATAGESTPLIGGTTLSAGVVYHIVGQRRAGTLELYINGVSDGTLSDANSSTSTAIMAIGRIGSVSTAYFGGTIYKLGITKGSSLSAIQVAARYRNSIARRILNRADYNYGFRDTGSTLVDSVGGLNLTAYNSPTMESGGGVTFNGTTQYAEIASSPTMSGALTVGMLVYITDWSATAIILGLSDGTATRGLVIGTHLNRLLANVTNGGAGAKTSNSHVGVPGWYRIFVVKDSSTNVSLIQVDGVDETGTTGVSYYTVAATALTRMGRAMVDPDGGFVACTVTTLKIWERALSAAEISNVEL